MTEEEWLTSEISLNMIRHLIYEGGIQRKRWLVTQRQLRLFCTACHAASYGIESALNKKLGGYATWDKGKRRGDDAWPVANSWCQSDWLEAGEIGQGHKANLLREIVGNPFRKIKWCPRETRDLISLARAAFDDRTRQCLRCNRWTDCQFCLNSRRLPTWDGGLDPARLCVLADAIEEAGGPDEMVSHLRFGQKVWDPGLSGWRVTFDRHHRGCWVIDHILKWSDK